jgi:hypothetical protein
MGGQTWQPLSTASLNVVKLVDECMYVPVMIIMLTILLLAGDTQHWCPTR